LEHLANIHSPIYMDTNQRPNFVLVCIAVVLLSFSFAGEMLCSLSPDTTPQNTLSNSGIAALPQSGPTLILVQPAPQVILPLHFKPNSLAAAIANEAREQELAALVADFVNNSNSEEALDHMIGPDVSVVEASVKTNVVSSNHQVTYNLAVGSREALHNLNKPAPVKRSPLLASSRNRTAKPTVVAISVSSNGSGLAALLPSFYRNQQTKSKLMKAVEMVNLSDITSEKLKLAVLKKVSQDLTAIKPNAEIQPNGETEMSVAEELVAYLKKLVGYSAEEKIYALKNLSNKKIEALKKILNAHNITLRAFVKA